MTSVWWKTWTWLVTVCLAFVALPACQSYDQLVEKDEVCNQRWGDYQGQLQRRADLVPNLVATVRGAAQHEEKVLTEVTQARAEATSIKLSADDLTDPAKVAAFQKAQDNLKGALSRLLVANESYPELRANESFRNLQVELAGTENRIQRSREQYNEAVKDYNSELRKVRGTVVNKATGKPFAPRQYFEASASAQVAPSVNFETSPASSGR